MLDPDDVVEEWHDGPETGESLNDALARRMGWTSEQTEHWIVHGKIE